MAWDSETEDGKPYEMERNASGDPLLPRRVRLDLGHGIVVSIIQGNGAYAGNGTVEACIINETGHGEPKGWLDANGLIKVIRRAQRIAKRKGESDVNEL